MCTQINIFVSIVSASTVYNNIETFAALDPAAMSAAMLSNMKYLSKKGE